MNVDATHRSMLVSIVRMAIEQAKYLEIHQMYSAEHRRRERENRATEDAAETGSNTSVSPAAERRASRGRGGARN